jgi:Domain of unknown function (DUF1707)
MEGSELGLRVSDAEREAAVVALREHFFAGRLDVEEFTARVERAYAARTLADLRAVEQELPVSAHVVRPARKPWLLPGNTSFAVRIHTRDPPARAVEEALASVFPRLAGSGYEPREEQPSKRVYVREERPAWTLVVAVLLFPLGLIALAHRVRSHFVVSAKRADHGLTAVDIYGTAPLAVRRVVRDRAATS